MSGRKDTNVYVGSDNSQVTGEAILALLAIPVGAGILAYYAGKTIVKGGIAAGKSVVNAAKAYEEHLRQQEIKRQQMLEKRLRQELKELTQIIADYSAILKKTSAHPLVKNVDFSLDREFLANLQKGEFSQTLDTVLEIKQRIQKRVQFLQEQGDLCQQIWPQVQALQNEIEQMANLFQHEKSLPDSSWPRQLEQMCSGLQSVTLESFYSFQKRWATWKLEVVGKMKSLEIQTQAKLELEALRQRVPCSPEEAQQIDPSGYSQLQKLEQHILNQTGVVSSGNLQVILQDYRTALERHVAILVPELEKIKEQKKRQEAVWKKYAPKFEELENLLELAQSEIVMRWQESTLVALRNALEDLREVCHGGEAAVIEKQMQEWRERYEEMLKTAGMQQRAEERREYIVQSMKTVLPELGFNIQLIQSESDAKSNTIIKVVPAEDSRSRHPRRITISIPQADNEAVQYHFEGFKVEKSRVDGQMIEKNDDGKTTVQNIAEALRPFGIIVDEPYWKGNPDRIQKGAKDLPDSGPEEESYWQQPETRHMEMDM